MKTSQKITKGGKHQNSFYEAIITLLLNPEKNKYKVIEVYRQKLLMNIDAKLLNKKITQHDPANYVPGNTRAFQNIQINQCDTSHQ